MQYPAARTCDRCDTDDFYAEMLIDDDGVVIGVAYECKVCGEITLEWSDDVLEQ